MKCASHLLAFYLLRAPISKCRDPSTQHQAGADQAAVLQEALLGQCTAGPIAGLAWEGGVFGCSRAQDLGCASWLVFQEGIGESVPLDK